MKKRLIRLISVAVTLAILGVVAWKAEHINVTYIPDYASIDISEILNKESLSDEDYLTLFYQTGLSKTAIDEMSADEILVCQENFFKEREIDCVRAAITTSMEYTCDSFGNHIPSFSLAPVKPGYVLIMESSHSFFWRHGHAGIVIDENTTLEASMIGTLSGSYNTDEWEYYPRFVMLKLKDADESELKDIARNAKRKLTGIPYSPFAGIFEKKTKRPKTTQCAHLVWCAFNNAGIDIDSNGGRIVTVQDILNSDKLEVVQIFGYDPDIFAGRLA